MTVFKFTPYAIPSLISVFFCLGLAYRGWQHWKESKINQVYTIMMLASAWWAFCYTMRLCLTELPVERIFLNLQYIGISLVTMTWLLFGLYYSGRESWVSPTLVRLLLIHPILMQIVAWTNIVHEKMFANMHMAIESPFPIIKADFGPIFWLHSGYSYILLLMGLVFLFAVARTQIRSLYRNQAILLVIGALVPFLLNLVFLLNWTPLDLTSPGFMLFGLAMAWGILRYRLLDLQPVAHTLVFNHISDAVFVLDKENQLIELNEAAQALIQQPAKNVLGKPIQQALSPIFEVLYNHIGKVDTQTEIQMGNRYFDLHTSFLMGQNEEQQGQVITLHETTERKLVEIERENLIAELDAYARTVAHDLKTPLTVLTGYSDLMVTMSGNLPEVTQKRLKVLHRTSRKMTHIVDELLTLATIRNKEDIPQDPLDMKQIVEEAIERVTPMMEDSGATIEWIEEWSTAVGYALWIEEVWVNYISNAIKYGGSPPHIILGADPPRDGFIRFWVQDNGPGLTAEEQTAVFATFTRLEQHQNLSGHGLGLSIVQRIVSKLGGTVGLESQVGEGSYFYFLLPIYTE